MATGYQYRTSSDASINIVHTAGALIAALDDFFTTGSLPWSKTVNGTNDVTYQAPGGSQVKLRVYDNVSSSTSYFRRLTAQVGSGAVFPTTTQEATGNQGFVKIRIRNTGSSGDSFDTRWRGVRTDRFAIFEVTATGGGTVMGGMFCVGDIPTLLPGDPGMCVLMGGAGSTTHTSLSIGVTGGILEGVASSGVFGYGVRGYAELSFSGAVTPVPVGVFAPYLSNYLSSPTVHGSQMILSKLLVVSGTTTTGTNPFSTIRGMIPYLRVPAHNQSLGGYALGDTLTDADGATYVIGRSTTEGAGHYALMTNDSEAGLP